ELLNLRNQQVDVIGGTNDKTDSDRRVAVLDRQIAAAEERLRAMQTTDVPRSGRAGKNPRYEHLHTLLDEAELEAAAARAANGCRAARLERLRSRLQELENLGPRYQSLLAEIAAQSADSKALQENLGKIQLLNLLDEHKLSNIRVLEAG